MVKLRLMRMGKKKQPTYRVVAADARSPRDGRFLEIVGHYDPRREPSTIVIDNDKAVAWLRKGAQPTDTVRKLLTVSGAWAEFTGETFVAPEPPAPKAKGKGKAAAEDAAPAADTGDDAAAEESAETVEA